MCCANYLNSIFEKDGSNVIVDKVSLDLVKGATIDYTTDLMKVLNLSLYNL